MLQLRALSPGDRRDRVSRSEYHKAQHRVGRKSKVDGSATYLPWLQIADDWRDVGCLVGSQTRTARYRDGVGTVNLVRDG